jgi:hypothetical protein
MLVVIFICQNDNTPFQKVCHFGYRVCHLVFVYVEWIDIANTEYRHQNTGKY